MRITESRLRRIIRSVISEIADTRKITSKSEFFQKLMECIDDNFPVNEEQVYSFSFNGSDPFSMNVNNESVVGLDSFLEDLYVMHTDNVGSLPLNVCCERMIGFLEAEGLVTVTTYNARKSDVDIRRAEMEADPRIKAFKKAFYGNGK